jgi:signal transduction histidine kinase
MATPGFASVTIRKAAWIAGCVASVLAAAALTAVARRFADETMYVFFVAAVTLVAWRGGWRLGLLTTTLSITAVDFFFVEPVGSFRVLAADSVARLVSFTLVALAVIAITRELRMARQRADAAARAERAARDAAERVSAERARFLSTLSHEVRTPINAMLGYTDLLDAGVAGPLTGQQLAFLRRVRDAGHHLLKVVNDVLDIAKAEAGHVQVQRQPVVLSAIVDTALELTAPQAAAKHLTIEPQLSDKSLVCIGDADRIEQILINLVANAVKFTPPDGRVIVTSGKAVNDGMVWLSVSDSGPGIGVEDQERIFQPFEKGKTPQQGNVGGAGLGLAISRQLAQLQGGSLAVSSEPGHGACFTLTLPGRG